MQQIDYNNITQNAKVEELPIQLRYGEDYRKLESKLGRITSHIYPDTPAKQPVGANASPIIRYTIPNSGRLDGNIAWSFKATCAVSGGGTGPSFCYNMFSIIQRLKIKYGSVVVYDCDNFNILCNIFNMSDDSLQWQTSYGFQSCGMIPFREDTYVNDRLVLGRKSRASSSNRYVLPLDLSLLNKCLPTVAELVPNVSLSIEIYLAPPNTVIETDSGTNVTYEIDDQYLIVESLLEPQPVIDQLKSELRAKGYLAIPYQKITSQQNLISANSSGAVQLQINDKVTSMKSVLHVFQNNGPTGDVLTNPTVWNKMNAFSPANIETLQYKANGILTPQDTIDCANSGAEILRELQIVFGNSSSSQSYASTSFNMGYGLNGSSGGGYTGPAMRLGSVWSDADNISAGTEIDKPKRIYGYSFEPPILTSDLADAAEYKKTVGNGINTAQSSSGLQVLFRKSTDANTYQLTTFTFSDALLIFSESGNSLISVSN